MNQLGNPKCCTIPYNLFSDCLRCIGLNGTTPPHISTQGKSSSNSFFALSLFGCFIENSNSATKLFSFTYSENFSNRPCFEETFADTL